MCQELPAIEQSSSTTNIFPLNDILPIVSGMVNEIGMAHAYSCSKSGEELVLLGSLDHLAPVLSGKCVHTPKEEQSEALHQQEGPPAKHNPIQYLLPSQHLQRSDTAS